MQTIVEQNRIRDYERFTENRIFEEVTDISERISYRTDHTIQYVMRNGAAYCTTDTEDRAFHDATHKSMVRGQRLFTGPNQFEAVRLTHEHNEMLMVDDFGEGKLDGNVLAKISKFPDAVRDNTAVDMAGYRKDIKRTFVRLYYPTETGISCRLFSLDQTDDEALAMVGNTLGIDARPGRSSEDILADHALLDLWHLDDAAIDELVERVVGAYDSVLYRKTGKKLSAGSPHTDREDALSAVKRHDFLLREHLDDISKIMGMAISPKAKEKLLEERRARTAAAITMSKEGKVVTSANGSDVAERAASGNFGRQCATGSEEAAMNAAGMSQGQKRERKLKKGVCQACLQPGTVGECSVCMSCERDDNLGIDLLKRRQKALARLAAREAMKRRTESDTQQRLARTKPEKSGSKADLIKASYGKNARLRTEIVLGGEQQVVYDFVTGQEIRRL